MRTDGQLLARAANADRNAFAVLYERHAKRAIRFAMRVVHEIHLAEEVLQETTIQQSQLDDMTDGRRIHARPPRPPRPGRGGRLSIRIARDEEGMSIRTPGKPVEEEE